MDYNKYLLRDLCFIITKGTTPSTIGFSFTNEGINFIKSEQLTNQRNIDYQKINYISEDAHARLSRSILQENDILISIAGAYLGKLALVNKRDLPANTNQAVGIIRANEHKININYLFYYMLSSRIKKIISNYNAQSAQPNINLNQLGNIEIFVPNLNQQQHIVNIQEKGNLLCY